MNMRENDSPVIKTFMYSGRYYFYDAYSNQLFEISKKQYVELLQLQRVGIISYKKLQKNTQPYNDIIWLINRGLISPPFIEKVEHTMTKHVSCLVERCISYLILQVTRDCNFNCRYCLNASESSEKIERDHKSENMSWSIAKKSVDYLFEHSKDAREIKIAFYGGEPLLNFKLIKKTVEYAKVLFIAKKIKFVMTTNASVLNDEILEFLILHNFNITLSFDGPKHIQNKHRKFATTGRGSFDIVWNNIKKIKNKSPSFFQNNVLFHPVLFVDENSEEIMTFFEKEHIAEKNIIPQYADTQGIDYKISIFDYDAHKYNNLTKNFEKQDYEKKRELLASKAKIPTVWHHAGPCVPGVLRLYVDVNGFFYPCEKTSSSVIIGSIDTGLDVKKVSEILNIAKLSENECKKCWGIRFCSMCVNHCVDISNNQICRTVKTENCIRQKKLIETFFKKYIDERLLQ